MIRRSHHRPGNLQGDVMTVVICKDNERINEDIKLFSPALSDDDEIISERL
jgi:hypothetical protein